MKDDVPNLKDYSQTRDEANMNADIQSENEA